MSGYYGSPVCYLRMCLTCFTLKFEIGPALGSWWCSFLVLPPNHLEVPEPRTKYARIQADNIPHWKKLSLNIFVTLLVYAESDECSSLCSSGAQSERRSRLTSSKHLIPLGCPGNAVEIDVAKSAKRKLISSTRFVAESGCGCLLE